MELTAWDIYWIMQADGFKVLAGVVCAIIGVVAAFPLFIGLAERENRVVAAGLAAMVLAAVLGVAAAFIPSTKTLIAMYAVPAIVTPENVERATGEADELLSLTKDWLRAKASESGTTNEGN